MQDIEQNAEEGIGIILVANKVDLEDKRSVTNKEGIELARKFNVPYFESSAVTGLNLDEIFSESAKKYMSTHLEETKEAPVGIY